MNIYTTGSAPQKILAVLQLEDPDIILIAKDIQNIVKKVYQQELLGKIPIQWLHDTLSAGGYQFRFDVDVNDYIDSSFPEFKSITCYDADDADVTDSYNSTRAISISVRNTSITADDAYVIISIQAVAVTGPESTKSNDDAGASPSHYSSSIRVELSSFEYLFPITKPPPFSCDAGTPVSTTFRLRYAYSASIACSTSISMSFDGRVYKYTVRTGKIA
ncbi:hypothetical protein NA56DRAFT_713223 [Hyaloscypha hepaticicola]|uniref:Uncharacterized protein n=1 Tax=Hyaloscypha hepaticicola TaxID=2082293 RepID=A0A2J6PER7_9HELO|nr:hypothetical protein NA56DRAFT_713223 [Hyaloscypha hepaticicola]